MNEILHFPLNIPLENSLRVKMIWAQRPIKHHNTAVVQSNILLPTQFQTFWYAHPIIS